jgi:hypothetical protein
MELAMEMGEVEVEVEFPIKSGSDRREGMIETREKMRRQERVGKKGLTCKTQYFPPFFFFKISSASSSYPGAITPSETSLEIIFAVGVSTIWDKAMKSPNEDILSAPVY